MKRVFVWLITLSPQMAPAVELNPQAHALAAPCLACHGQVRPNQAIPVLAGLSAAEISLAMQDFRSGRRPASIMGRIAPGYSDAEIALIAESLPLLRQ